MTAPATRLAANAATAEVPLRHDPVFVRWFVADTALHCGQAFIGTALPLLAASTAGASVQAGLVVAAHAVGSLVGLLPGGVLADRMDRRRLVPTLCALGTGLLAALAVLARSPQPPAWAVALVCGGTGLVTALVSPSFTATLKRLVSPSRFPVAAGAAEGRSALVALILPPLGGVLFGVAPALPFVVAAGLAALAAPAFRALPPHAASPLRADSGRQAYRSVLDGARFVLHNPLLRALLAMGTLANLATSLVVMATIFELHSRGVPAVVIGSMNAVVAVGSIVGAVAASLWAPRLPAGRIVLVSLAWIIAWLAPLAIASEAWVVIALIAGAVIAAPALNAVMGGLMVALVPDGLQGRVDAAVALCASITAPLAPLAAGVALQTVGFRGALVAGASLIVAAALPVLASPRVIQLPPLVTWDKRDRSAC